MKVTAPQSTEQIWINYVPHFVAVTYFEAIYKTQSDEQRLLFEVRTDHKGDQQFFTVINGLPMRVPYIEKFVASQPECVSLSITHTLPILWNSDSRICTLIETFLPPTGDTPYSPITLKLIVDDVEFETTECDTLSDASSELYELTQAAKVDKHWRFQTCWDCRYSRPAFLSPCSDRDDLRCYRDAPQSFAEIEAKSKFASQEAWLDGDYFVNAFHRCSGWEVYKPPSWVSARTANGEIAGAKQPPAQVPSGDKSVIFKFLTKLIRSFLRFHLF